MFVLGDLLIMDFDTATADIFFNSNLSVLIADLSGKGIHIFGGL